MSHIFDLSAGMVRLAERQLSECHRKSAHNALILSRHLGVHGRGTPQPDGGTGMRTQASADGGVQSPTSEVEQTPLAKLVYTIDELCQVVGISRATVYKEIKEQRLRVRKVGKRTLVPVDEVRAWLKI